MATYDGLNKKLKLLEELISGLRGGDDQAFPVDIAVLTEMERPIWVSFWASIADRVHRAMTGTISLVELTNDELSELKRWVLLARDRQVSREV